MVTEISINPKCTFLNNYPFLLLSLIVIIMDVIIPLIDYYFHWKSKSSRDTNNILMGNKNISLPSISRTWRNTYVLLPVLSGAIAMVEVYLICLTTTMTFLYLLLGLFLALLVFLFNEDHGKIAKAHSVFAFMFFAYLMVTVSLISTYYPDYYAWYWPYIPMGICLLIMLISSIVDRNLPSWPWYVSVAEYIFILTFFIHLLMLP